MWCTKCSRVKLGCRAEDANAKRRYCEDDNNNSKLAGSTAQHRTATLLLSFLPYKQGYLCIHDAARDLLQLLSKLFKVLWFIEF